MMLRGSSAKDAGKASERKQYYSALMKSGSKDREEEEQLDPTVDSTEASLDPIFIRPTAVVTRKTTLEGHEEGEEEDEDPWHHPAVQDAANESQTSTPTGKEILFASCDDSLSTITNAPTDQQGDVSTRSGSKHSRRRRRKSSHKKLRSRREAEEEEAARQKEERLETQRHYLRWQQHYSIQRYQQKFQLERLQQKLKEAQKEEQIQSPSSVTLNKDRDHNARKSMQNNTDNGEEDAHPPMVCRSTGFECIALHDEDEALVLLPDTPLPCDSTTWLAPSKTFDSVQAEKSAMATNTDEANGESDHLTESQHNVDTNSFQDEKVSDDQDQEDSAINTGDPTAVPEKETSDDQDQDQEETVINTEEPTVVPKKETSYDRDDSATNMEEPTADPNEETSGDHEDRATITKEPTADPNEETSDDDDTTDDDATTTDNTDHSAETNKVENVRSALSMAQSFYNQSKYDKLRSSKSKSHSRRSSHKKFSVKPTIVEEEEEIACTASPPKDCMDINDDAPPAGLEDELQESPVEEEEQEGSPSPVLEDELQVSPVEEEEQEGRPSPALEEELQVSPVEEEEQEATCLISSPQESLVDNDDAPAGTLGVVLDTPGDEPPAVQEINPSSVPDEPQVSPLQPPSAQLGDEAIVLGNDEHTGVAAPCADLIEIYAPAGKLGIRLHPGSDGQLSVHQMKPDSVLKDELRVGDKVLAIDDQDARRMSAKEAAKILSAKANNPTRKFSICGQQRQQMQSPLSQPGDAAPAKSSDNHNNVVAPGKDLIEIDAPAGKLGIALITGSDGKLTVHQVRPNSVLHGKLQVGDKVLSLDYVDVRMMSAKQVTGILGRKAENTTRKFTVMRHQQQVQSPSSQSGDSANVSPAQPPSSQSGDAVNISPVRAKDRHISWHNDVPMAPGEGVAVAPREQLVEINAPAGKLGIVLEPGSNGQLAVIEIRPNSVLKDKLQLGDRMIALDDEGVQMMSAKEFLKIVGKKANNPSRKFSVVRTI